MTCSYQNQSKDESLILTVQYLVSTVCLGKWSLRNCQKNVHTVLIWKDWWLAKQVGEC